MNLTTTLQEGLVYQTNWLWIEFPQCIRENYVNCSFGTEGPCRTVRHQDRSFMDKWNAEQRALKASMFEDEDEEE